MNNRTTWPNKAASPILQSSASGLVDTATLELLAAWKAEDAITDPGKLREADEEIAQFKKALNNNRATAGLVRCFHEPLRRSCSQIVQCGGPRTNAPGNRENDTQVETAPASPQYS